jgi:hypothetical protein
MKGVEVSGQEVFEDLGREKLDIEHLAEGQDHEEAVEWPVADSAGVSPIHLGFFSWQGLDMEKGFLLRPDVSQMGSQDADAAGIACLADFFLDAHGAHPGIRRKELIDLLPERFEFGWSRPWIFTIRIVLFEGAANGLGIKVQFPGDGLLGESFGKVEMADVAPCFDIHVMTS